MGSVTTERLLFLRAMSKQTSMENDEEIKPVFGTPPEELKEMIRKKKQAEKVDPALIH